MAIGEEGGWETRLQPIEMGKIENDFECNFCQEIEPIAASDLS